MVIACGIEHGATNVHSVPLPVCETKMIVVAVGVASGICVLGEQAAKTKASANNNLIMNSLSRRFVNNAESIRFTASVLSLHFPAAMSMSFVASETLLDNVSPYRKPGGYEATPPDAAPLMSVT